MFNERMVGFALIEKNQLSLLAVHGATRHRGVGTQMITLLLKKKPHLAVDPQVKDIQFIAFFESLKAMNP